MRFLESNGRAPGLLAVLTLATLGCEGSVGSPVHTPDPRQEGPRPTVIGPQPGEAFSVERQQVRLLAFSVRMTKLSAIVGVPLDSPLFEALYADRLSLGDHDYAHGVPVSRSWSAHQMSVWVKDLLPVCGSEEMRTRYPSLVTDPTSFIEVAYGRRADPDDRALLEEAVAEVGGLDDDGKFRGVCLALLSSAEMLVE